MSTKYESEVEAFATATAEATKRREALMARLSASATVVRRVMDKKFAHRPPLEEWDFKVLKWAYARPGASLTVTKCGGVKLDDNNVHPLFLTGDQGAVGREVRKLIRKYKVKQAEDIRRRELSALRSEFTEAEREYTKTKRRVTKAAEALWAKRDQMPGIEQHIRPYLKETTND